MANGGIIGPVKVVCTPATKVTSFTSSGTLTRHNCSVTTAPEILVANIDGANAADITIEVSVDNGSNYVKLANTISVPADATLSFLENPIYLDETDLLYFTASAANDLSYFVSYEELDDA